MSKVIKFPNVAEWVRIAAWNKKGLIFSKISYMSLELLECFVIFIEKFYNISLYYLFVSKKFHDFIWFWDCKIVTMIIRNTCLSMVKTFKFITTEFLAWIWWRSIKYTCRILELLLSNWMWLILRFIIMWYAFDIFECSES